MINEKMEKAINEQINAELYSAYLYLSMSAYFESINLDGFASWMKTQAQEETFHALKFFDYVHERGGKVQLKAINAPEAKWDSAVAAFQQTFEHEQSVTGMINNLVDIAIELKDHATKSLLNWFVDEQVEEESTADGLLQKLKMIGDSPALYQLDKEVGQRVFTPPTAQ